MGLLFSQPEGKHGAWGVVMPRIAFGPKHAGVDCIDPGVNRTPPIKKNKI